MNCGQLVLVRCKITRSAFSGERVFASKMIGGDGWYFGISPRGHCLDESLNPLEKDYPNGGFSAYGFVEAIQIRSNTDSTYVEFPDGQAVEIPADQVSHKVVTVTETKPV